MDALPLAESIRQMIGIVIVSYRSDDRTVAFVQGQLSRLSEPHRIVVVDNGATEEEAAALAGRIPEAVVIPAENRGFAAGNNLGVQYLEEKVHPDYILFTNNDIEFTEDGVIETLVRTAEAHPEAGAFGPAVVGLDGKRQGPEPYQGLWKRFVWMYLSTPFLSKSAKRRLFDLDYPEMAGEGPHYKLSGSFLLVRTADFLQAGGFDEKTFLYAEENILSERFARIGYLLGNRGITDIANVPRLVAVPRNVFLALEVAQDKAMFGKLLVNLGPHLGILHHVLVQVHILAVDVQVQVKRQPRMMLGIAGHGDVLLHIVLAVLLREVVDDALLLGHTASRGIEVHLHTVFLQIGLQLEVGVVGPLLHLDVIAERILHGHGLQRVFPALRQLPPAAGSACSPAPGNQSDIPLQTRTRTKPPGFRIPSWQTCR